MLLHQDHTVPVFTPDHYFITYVGMHLPPFGARYYSEMLVAMETK